MKQKISLLLLIIALLAISCSTRRDYGNDEFMTNLVGETSQQKCERMQWWQDAKLGAFFEWGLFSSLGGSYQGYTANYAAWILQLTGMEPEVYESYASKFNPEKLVENPFLNNLYAAGFRYVIFTAKHHDGFSLYDTKYSDYNIVKATPYGKDVLRELMNIAKKQNLKTGVYYSILDWNHPTQATFNAEGKKLPVKGNTKFATPEAKVEYINYMKNQLTELVVNYDPDIVWFDGDTPDWWTPEDGLEVLMALRLLKPSIIVNDRIGLRRDVDGDFQTIARNASWKEKRNISRNWELYISLDDTWGYNREWSLMRKSSQDVVKRLIDTVSLGGNILLNIGPDMRGEVKEEEIQTAQEVGTWINKNKVAIYGTYPVKDKNAFWGRYTQDTNNYYYHIFTKPFFSTISFSVKKFPDGFKNAYFLEDENKTPLEIKLDEKGRNYVIDVSENMPDSILPVLVLEKTEEDVKNCVLSIN
ncbi:MAG: alpha-L-fucosidase [Spirochaetales bacterium]|nr:alpha-L-fucosidase [Spirochaetales bacterium]